MGREIEARERVRVGAREDKNGAREREWDEREGETGARERVRVGQERG